MSDTPDVARPGLQLAETSRRRELLPGQRRPRRLGPETIADMTELFEDMDLSGLTNT
ncbi:hypothetical protein [Streptomyces sp. NRRL S-146]|uniref:hypothetical protein n=1 Tax=Streptomyces sp. NRRL S-146 TaxID=1463884 RepID=UPI00131A990E|nr:hypothetical protein [Streptomyces sp. NRRL S-146]